MQAEWGPWHLPERLHYQDPITVPLCSSYGLRHMLVRSERVTGWTVVVQIILRHFFIGDEITEQMAELAASRSASIQWRTDLGLDGEAEEARSLENRVAWHLGYLYDILRMHVDKSRWHVYMCIIVTQTHLADPSDGVVATIPPNPDFPEARVASPQPPLIRRDCVVTAKSGINLRVSTGEGAVYAEKDLVNEVPCINLPVNCVDPLGALGIGYPYPSLAIDTLLESSVQTGILEPNAPIHDLA
ncbi:hypothetical protein C8T65DRAFT_827443 [Cerioporus squamosus]|nr:hypothetical protein C8T65DRAFT_827443 [Cerioporus squamosus]